MTDPSNIIGLVRELQEWHETEAKNDETGDVYGKWSGYVAESFPAIASAFLAREEALKVAVEAMEFAIANLRKFTPGNTALPACVQAMLVVDLRRLHALVPSLSPSQQ